VAGTAVLIAVLGMIAGQSAHNRALADPPPDAPYSKVAYFDQWSIYGNSYFVKNLDASGAAAKLDVLQYAFEGIDDANLTCHENSWDSTGIHTADHRAGDPYADYQKSFDASNSVDGTVDAWGPTLKGNFNQLKQLKAKHPSLKVLISIGGATYSTHFAAAAATDAARKKFVKSCIDLFIKGDLPVEPDGQIPGDPTGGVGAAAGIFDGFDLDWEFPSNTTEKTNFTLLLKEFRDELTAYTAGTSGTSYLLSAALPPGQDKIKNIETDQIAQYLDFADLMTYDLHGGWDTAGPTNFQSPLHDSSGDPSDAVPPGSAKYNVDTTIAAWTDGLPDYGIPGGFPAAKLNLGIPFYWRGWTGVEAGPNHGLYQPASGPSPAFPFSQGAGVAFWKELKTAGLTDNPADNFYDPTTQSSWIYDGTNFYTGDTPSSIAAKRAYLASKGLGGAVAYALEMDDVSGTLINAVLSSTAGDNTQASVQVGGGARTLVPPPAVSFAGLLSGTDVDITATQPIGVDDNTGTGAGWHVTLTATTFTHDSYTLPGTALTDTGVAGDCDPSITCTPARSVGVNYPLVISAGNTVTIMNAAQDSGMANQTWVHTMNLHVPRDAHVGVYTSTWTYSLVSTP
jgi:chitinase